MNANPKFMSADAHVDAAAVAPLPNSRKVYVSGSRPDIRVPMREITQSDTPDSFGGEKNPPVFVYDTSGPYSDPEAHIDIRSGLPALRQEVRLDVRAGALTSVHDIAEGGLLTAVVESALSGGLGAALDLGDVDDVWTTLFGERAGGSRSGSKRRPSRSAPTRSGSRTPRSQAPSCSRIPSSSPARSLTNCLT